MRQQTRAVVEELRSVADPSRKPGMARVGINVERALGVSIPNCRRIARGHRGDHPLALDLWSTEIHEARILASMGSAITVAASARSISPTGSSSWVPMKMPAVNRSRVADGSIISRATFRPIASDGIT